MARDLREHAKELYAVNALHLIARARNALTRLLVTRCWIIQETPGLTSTFSFVRSRKSQPSYLVLFESSFNVTSSAVCIPNAASLRMGLTHSHLGSGMSQGSCPQHLTASETHMCEGRVVTRMVSSYGIVLNIDQREYVNGQH